MQKQGKCLYIFYSLTYRGSVGHTPQMIRIPSAIMSLFLWKYEEKRERRYIKSLNIKINYPTYSRNIDDL